MLQLTDFPDITYTQFWILDWLLDGQSQNLRDFRRLNLRRLNL